MNISDLEKIASDKSGWDTLYFHKESKSYWERTYPNSNYHGGGNPTLKKIDITKDVKLKYNIQ